MTLRLWVVSVLALVAPPAVADPARDGLAAWSRIPVAPTVMWGPVTDLCGPVQVTERRVRMV